MKKEIWKENVVKNKFVRKKKRHTRCLTEFFCQTITQIATLEESSCIAVLTTWPNEPLNNH